MPFDSSFAGRIIAEKILSDDERLSIFEGLKIPPAYSGYRINKDLTTKDWCAVKQSFR